MAWIFQHSATWRRIVVTTRDSPVAMLGFTVTCFGVAYGLGKLTMAGTDREAKLEAKLRGSMTMDHKVGRVLQSIRDSRTGPGCRS